MEKEILCRTLAEVFEYIEQNIEDGIVYTIEMALEKEEVADES